MALPPLEELRGGQRDGTAQGERFRPELAPGAIGIDERSPAELLRFVRRFAAQLYWHGPDNRPGGWWAKAETGADTGAPQVGEPPRQGPAFFDGVGPSEDDRDALSYAEVAAFAADPAAFPGERYAPLRRPHMALLLTAVHLLRHGQRAVNALVDRHIDYHLDTLLRLAPKPPTPDRAFVLFELAPGVAEAEVPAGLRLLAGRDARHRDRVYRLEQGLVVNRARVARLSSSFVDRDVIGLAEARRSITGTPAEQFLFLLSIALGDPRPGDPLPPLRGTPVTQPRLAAIQQLIGFAPGGLSMELFDLRALLARKSRRADEATDWARINRIIEAAGKAKRGDPNWTLTPADPADFHANLVAALQGEPDLAGLTEVATVDDLALHLDRADVRAAIKAKLFLDLRQFATMIDAKRAIDADWTVINRYLQRAGEPRHADDPKWTLPIKRQGDFAANLAAAIGPIDFAAAGPEASGVTDLDSFMARIAEIEAYFLMSAENVARLIGTFGADETLPAGAAAWRGAYDLLAGAYTRKARAAGMAELALVRNSAPPGSDGLVAEMTAALGDLPPGTDAQLETLGRYASTDDVVVVGAALGLKRRSGVDWDRIDAILEAARRRRLRLPEPVAQKQHWRALFAYDDARLASAGGDAAGAWHAFGGLPADAGPDQLPAGIGWAIASPMLDLSAGRRRITLSLGFHADGGGPLLAPSDDHGDSPAKLPFTVTLSGAKGWIDPTDVAFAEIDYRTVPGIAKVDAATPLLGLQVTLTLDESAPATAASGTAIFGGTEWPALRLMLRPVWDPQRGHFDTAYERFRALRLARVNVAVAVGKFVSDGSPGLWPLTVETETGVANGKKPFEPFGPAPSVDTELALGHRDLLHKNLTQVSLALEWLGGPPDLLKWYAHYPDRNLVAQLSVVDAVRTTKLGAPGALFASADANVPQRIDRDVAGGAPPDAVPSPGGAEVRGWRRYLTLRLTGTDFGHHEYPSLVTSFSIDLANKLRKGEEVAAAGFAINPPYTPKLKRLALDFTARQEIDLARYDPAGIDRLFHVDAFGIDEAVAADDGWPLLPAHEEQGALYIGLDGVSAPQSLSLLFAAVDSGSAADRAGPVDWAWLDARGWMRFPTPPEDDTDGLTRSGVIRFALPAAAPDARMPGGLYWLRATMDWGAASAADLIDIHAQAGTAVFVDDDPPPEHYLAPLPAKSIRALGDPAPGIARIVQPYPSRDGQPAETATAFRARAGERLRHKQRALTLWDYERLVLERFPAVHKVKCLPARTADGLGLVRLVIIPDIRGQVRADPFAPRAPARLLDEIAAWLAPLTPPTARIAVGHASFVQVRVRVGVRFRARGDEEFDKRRLSERLNRYLAPWAYDEGADIAIGQRIDATSIVAFIDQLPFVDFVGGCRLFVSTDGGESYHPGDDGGDHVEAAREDGVLTPAPRHEIDVIDDDVFEQQSFTGIGYMKVMLDFVVG